MSEIRDYVKTHPLPNNVTLETVTVYEVAKVPTLDTFASLAKEHLYSQEQSDRRQLFVHFGVHSTAKTFLLEQVAWNELNFRVPDQRGFQPTCQPICTADGPTDASKKCLLPLDKINATLSEQCRFHDVSMVELSTDPGRFLCNYLYYISLAETSKIKNAHSLFVHVPPFSAIPQDEQMRFIHALLVQLCDAASA